MSAPLLRWAGSKRQVLKVLAANVPAQFRRYIEPFAGSACLFFHLRPSAATLGDINPELVGAYRTIQLCPQDVFAELATLDRTEEAYYRARAVDPASLEPVPRAARFVFLNRLCFNGLYRTNMAGKFNVPYGGLKSGRLPDLPAFMEASAALCRTDLVAGDFSLALRRAREGDFVYLDPPYRTTTKRTFREYDAADFSPGDLDRIRRWLRRLDQRGATFLLSYLNSEEGSALARGYYSTVLRVRRNISGFVGSRGQTNEVLISNRPITVPECRLN